MADEHSPTQQQPPIYQPIPRRTFKAPSNRDAADSLTYAFSSPHPPRSPPSNLHNSRSSDFLAQLNARLLRTSNARADDVPDSPVDGAQLPRQNKSFLNMNSSTLCGIYEDLGTGETGTQSVADTPWGTGAETPGHTGMGWPGSDAGLSLEKARRRSVPSKEKEERRRGSQTRHGRRGLAKYAVPMAKLAALFTFGMLYGVVVSYLHDTRHLAAVRVQGVNRNSRVYVVGWGFAGVALGSLLPYVDVLWSRHSGPNDITDGEQESVDSDSESNSDIDSDPPISEQINDVVRSVAAFVGIAFAIRRLPWQSTLQLTLTLALVNPALWYILDRSKPGLSLSLIVTSLITSFLFLSNQTTLPSPSEASSGAPNATHTPPSPPSQADLFRGIVRYDDLAVVTWVGSVLFCSCVCFGSIGRRLAIWEGDWRRRRTGYRKS